MEHFLMSIAAALVIGAGIILGHWLYVRYRVKAERYVDEHAAGLWRH
jgi:purine-cytosine permease-like protein